MKQKNELPQNAVTLTPDQKEAYSQIIDFFNSKEQLYVLRGYAGSGKTFLVRLLANYLELKEREFYLVAPTGRAARILAMKTGFTASTIHSLIYSGAEESKLLDKVTENTTLKFNMKYNTHADDAVYIIDEASMIDDSSVGASGFLSFGSGQLLKDFFEHIQIAHTSKKKNVRRQVIFVGDPVQLPPVRQKYSCALEPEYLLSSYKLAAREFTLTHIVRQAEGSPILTFASAIRSTITEKELDISALSEGTGHAITAGQHIPEWKKRTSEQGEEQTILITHSNKQALNYNRMMRKAKYGMTGDDIRKGDRLLIVTNNRKYNLLNGDIVDVLSISKRGELLSIEPLFAKESTIQFHFRDATIGYTNEYNKYVETECKILLNLLVSPGAGLGREEYFALKELAMKECGAELPSRSLKKKDPEKFNEQMDEYEMMMAESPYLNALQVKFGYAVTCHKAQGGEWNNVFVDFNVYIDPASEEYFRWLYTAVTRAKENLYCLNLPATAGNQSGYHYVPYD